MENNLQITYVDIDTLRPADYNPRTWDKRQLADLKDNMRQFGFVVPVILNKAEGRLNIVIGGHMRLAAAKELVLEGLPDFRNIPAVHVVITDIAKEQELNLRLNKNQGQWDFDLLANFDETLLANVGFGGKELDKIFKADFIDEQMEADILGNPIDNLQTDIKPGDLYQLGSHRLLCGDCTQPENIQKLLGSEQVHLLLTDPPYGVAYSDKNEFLNEFDKGNRIQREIQNDNIKDYRAWFASWLKLIPFATPNTFYIFMASTELHNLRLAIDDAGLYFSQYLIWIKNNHVLSRHDYNHKEEFVIKGTKNKAQLVAYGWKDKHKFYKDDFALSVLCYRKPLKSELHPTMKPVPLLNDLILNSSQRGENVLDLFGGSGSTLVAAEKTGRRAFLSELDPKYCQTIIKRWEALTKQTAKKL